MTVEGKSLGNSVQEFIGLGESKGAAGSQRWDATRLRPLFLAA